MTLTARVFFVTTLIAFSSSSAQADPVTITAGSASVDIGGGSFFHFDLRGMGFSAKAIVHKDESGVGLEFQWPELVQPGQTVDTSSRWSIYHAYADPFSGDYWAGDFTFNGGLTPFLCSSHDDSGSDCSALTPFQFTGMLTRFNAAGQQVLRRELVGSGDATLSIGRNRIPLWLAYTFHDPAPVPEPSTLILFTLGGAQIGRAAWKRRGRRHLP